MQTLLFDEPFFLIFTASNKSAALYTSIVDKITSGAFKVQPSKYTQKVAFKVEVSNMVDACELMRRIGDAYAYVEDIRQNWNMGILDQLTYREMLSRHLTDSGVEFIYSLK